MTADLPPRLAVAARQLAAEMAVAQIQAILGPEGVDVLVLKGLHLAHTVYADPSERDFVDVDLLVRPRHWAKALEVLERAGYRRERRVPDRPLSDARNYNQAFWTPMGVAIEVHCDFAGHGRYPVDIDGLFARSVPFQMGSIESRGLGNEDLLLHLCLHMTKSYFDVEEKHVRDIALVIRHRPIRWPQFLDRVDRAGCRAGAFLALESAKFQHGAQAPDDVLEALAPRSWRLGLLSMQVNTRRFPMVSTTGNPGGLRPWLLGLPLMDRPSRWIPTAAKYGLLRVGDFVLHRMNRNIA